MIYVYCLIALMQGFLIWGQEELFLKANQLYQQGLYQDASLLYKSIEDKGAAVWHNLGNCHWYMQQYKDAFLAYKRASQDASLKDALILESLGAQAYKQWVTSDKEHLLCSRIEKVAILSTVFQWQLICLCIWMLLFLAIRFLPKGLWKTTFIIICFLLSALSFLILYHAQRKEKPCGIVTVPTKVFVAPRQDVYCLSSIGQGESIIIIDSCKDWAKVDARGIVGWIPRRNYELL